MFYFFITLKDLALGLKEDIFLRDLNVFLIDGYEGVIFEVARLDELLQRFHLRKVGQMKTHINLVERVFVLPKNVELEDNDFGKLGQIFCYAEINFSSISAEEQIQEAIKFFESIEDFSRERISREPLKFFSLYQQERENQKDVLDGDVQVLQKNIKEKEQAIAQLQEKVLKIEAVNGVGYYAEEYDALMEIDKIKSIEIKDDKMLIFTKKLYATDPRSRMRHEIGKFRIEIPILGKGKVRWFNLTRQIDAFRERQQAPHVWANGAACLGNTDETFKALIQNYEFAAAAFMAINFIESVNVEDPAGKLIHRWPKA